MVIILIFIQNINILFNGYDTGTQGSIDGYVVSLYIGVILSFVIILVQLFYKAYSNRNVKIIYIVFLIFSLSLYVENFKYLFYVTIKGYGINDVITGAAGTEIAWYAQNINERIYPVIFYLIITVNVLICFYNAFKKRNIDKKDII